MTAAPTVTSPRPSAEAASVAMVGALRALLLAEALGGLVAAIFLSMVASEAREALGGAEGQAREELLRFAAGGAFLVTIFAASASRGARRRRPWAWTMAAMLQVVIAIGVGLAVINVEWHPLFLAAFALPALVMLVLSTASVRRALGQS